MSFRDDLGQIIMCMEPIIFERRTAKLSRNLPPAAPACTSSEWACPLRLARAASVKLCGGSAVDDINTLHDLTCQKTPRNYGSMTYIYALPITIEILIITIRIDDDKISGNKIEITIVIVTVIGTAIYNCIQISLDQYDNKK